MTPGAADLRNCPRLEGVRNVLEQDAASTRAQLHPALHAYQVARNSRKAALQVKLDRRTAEIYDADDLRREPIRVQSAHLASLVAAEEDMLNEQAVADREFATRMQSTRGQKLIRGRSVLTVEWSPLPECLPGALIEKDLLIIELQPSSKHSKLLKPKTTKATLSLKRA